jgi:hypothetical protein
MNVSVGKCKSTCCKKSSKLRRFIQTLLNFLQHPVYLFQSFLVTRLVCCLRCATPFPVVVCINYHNGIEAFNIPNFLHIPNQMAQCHIVSFILYFILLNIPYNSINVFPSNIKITFNLFIICCDIFLFYKQIPSLQVNSRIHLRPYSRYILLVSCFL